jgi:hypothetical protein
MHQLVRAAISFVSFVATFYFVLWLPCSLLPLGDAFPLVAPILSLACAAAAARFVWTRTVRISSGCATSSVLGALIVGGIGFTGGFFGPMVFAPGANQGPLLGIFITGPLGALAGAIGGALWWGWRRRSNLEDGGGAVRAPKGAAPPRILA